MTQTTPSTPLIGDRIDTPLGALLVLADEAGRLHTAEFDDCGDRLESFVRRRRLVVQAGRADDALRTALGAYFAGDVAMLDGIDVVMHGTSFQERVWRGLRTVPVGTRLSYAAMATQIGEGGKARAVGHANGANPLAVVVPCHRLVGSGGALTGYAGGLWRKRWLLDHESANAGGDAVSDRP